MKLNSSQSGSRTAGFGGRLLFVLWAIPGAWAQAGALSGVVVAANDGQPLAGAWVTVQDNGRRAVTAADGTFALPGLSGQGLTVVAAARGFYHRALNLDAPAGGVVFNLEPVAGEDPGYQLWTPQNCGACHPRQLQEWTATPMARAGVNTWVHDLYSGTGTAGGLGGFVYTRDSVHAVVNPASECASCHQPEGWLAQPFSALDDNLTSPPPAVVHGVSCEICHKIGDVDVAKIDFPGLFPGAMHFTRPAGEQVEYGVLGDVAYEAGGVMRASLQPQLSDAVCGLCHQDKSAI